MLIAYQTKEGRKYRAKFKHGKEQIAKAGFKTQADAKAWIVEEKKRLDAQKAAGNVLMYSEACRAYLEDCDARMRKGTVQEKYRHYSELAAYLKKDAPLSSIDIPTAKKFSASVQKLRGNKAVNRYIRNCKALWNWWKAEGGIHDNPWTAVRLYPEEEFIKYIPPHEDVAAILMAAEPWERNFINVILKTGARSGEVRNLTWEDVDFSRRTITFWTRKRKGGERRSRTINMSPQLYEAMKSMWDDRDDVERRSPWVFVSEETGQGFTRQSRPVKYLMERLCERAGVKFFTLHALRHYVACKVRDSGKAAPFEIQRLLGHQRISTTEEYLKGLAPDLENAVSVLDDEPEHKQQAPKVINLADRK